MKNSLIIITVLLFLISGCADQSLDYLKRHHQMLVADMHSDTVLRIRDDSLNIALRDSSGHMDLPRLKEGGIDLQVFACWLPTGTDDSLCVDQIDELIDLLELQVKANPDQVEICLTASDARKSIGEGKLAAFIGIENGVAIANDIENLKHFYDRGVRYMTLTHTASSEWVISSADTMPAFPGLTDFGREVVQTMNELGMIVDISHASPEAVDEVLKITSAPVIASHSCVYSLKNHDRNLTDDQIKAVAENNGVIGINFYNGYLSQEWDDCSDSLYEIRKPEIDSLRELYKDDKDKRRESIWAIYRQIRKQIPDTLVSVKTVADHIDHIVKLVGPNHVGLGSDYDGVGAMPKGLEDCSGMPNITKELIDRGYAQEDIEKIMGGNFMRIFEEVCTN